MRYHLLLLAVLLLLGPLRAEEADGPQIKLLQVTPELAAVAAKAMEGCPARGAEVRGERNKNGVYTLTGELFRNGRIYAVIDNRENAVLCEWEDRKWNALFAIDLDVVWKYPGWDRETAGTREPDANKPFWMLTLQKQQLLIISSDEEKAGQNYVVILFDPQIGKIRDFDFSFSFAPSVKDNYLVTMDASRVKAEAGITYYSKIQEGKFVILKSWGDFCPWFASSHEDEQWNTASSGKTSYTIVEANGEEGQADGWLIYKEDRSKEMRGRLVDFVKKEAPFAKVSFIRKEREAADGTNDTDWMMAYLFEKLTGLSRQLYGLGNDYNPEDHPVGRIEAKGKIKVTGSEEARKLLSP